MKTHVRFSVRIFIDAFLSLLCSLNSCTCRKLTVFGGESAATQ